MSSVLLETSLRTGGRNLNLAHYITFRVRNAFLPRYEHSLVLKCACHDLQHQVVDIHDRYAAGVLSGEMMKSACTNTTQQSSKD